MTKLSFNKPHKNVVNGNNIRKQLENIKPMPKPMSEQTLSDIADKLYKAYRNKSQGETIWIDATTCVRIPPNASDEQYAAAWKAVCEHPKMIAQVNALEKYLDSQK